MKHTLLAFVAVLTALYAFAGIGPVDSIGDGRSSIIPASDSSRSDSLRSHRGKVGLVLSGGGAKGIAHVGVIKALEDNDIPIDYVTGTSMGAIVGSLYSCGWSPEKMMKFFTSKDFSYWSTGRLDRNLTYYFSEPSPSPEWFGLNLSLKKNRKKDDNIFSGVLPSSLISPFPMNMEFLKLFTPYTRQCSGNFNSLFVPFRCVTSDVYHKRKIVLGSGSLGNAVRASMSFPLVFRPIEIDSVLVFDGGIYDNFPVDVMHKDFDPDFIVGISVALPDGKPEQGDLYSQLEDMIIQNNDYSLPDSLGVKIQVPVSRFGVLDFPLAETIYEIGYRTGLQYVDSIRKRIPWRRTPAEVDARRREFSSRTPEILYDSISITGTYPMQRRYLEYVFSNGHRLPVDMKEVENAYYRVVSSSKFSELLPQNTLLKDGRNVLRLEADVKNPWNIGVGGWITSSNNSMLYLNFGYHTLSLNSLDADIGVWVGQSYAALRLSGRFALRRHVPSYVQLEAVASENKLFENQLMFYQNNTPAFLKEREGFLRATYCMATSRQSKAALSVSYGATSSRGYGGEPYSRIHTGPEADRLRLNTLAFNGEYDWNTLDNQMYPTSGERVLAQLFVTYDKNVAARHLVSENTDDSWRCTVKGYWTRYFPLSRNFMLGGSATGLFTLEKLWLDYVSTLIREAPFAPTPTTKGYFNPAFRGNNFLAFGVNPVWSPINNLQLRGDFNLFLPVRDIGKTTEGMARYDGWFRSPQFIGEVAAVYNFKFASLSLYCNYLSNPARNWNFGVSFGLFIQAPRLAER